MADIMWLVEDKPGHKGDWRWYKPHKTRKSARDHLRHLNRLFPADAHRITKWAPVPGTEEE